MKALREEDMLDREMGALTPWPMVISSHRTRVVWNPPSSPPVETPSKKRKTPSTNQSDISGNVKENDVRKGRQTKDLKQHSLKRIKLSDYTDDAGIGTKQDPICIEINPSSIWHPQEETVCRLLLYQALIHL